jgi:hypothetical protein
MKYVITLLSTILFFISVQAQNISKTIPICGETFTYSATVQPDRSIKVTITDINSATRKIEYTYTGNSVDDFKTIFKSQFQQITGVTCDDANVMILGGEAIIIWNTLYQKSLATLPQSYSKTVAIGDENFTYTGTFDTDNSIKVTIVNVDDATKIKEYNFAGSDATIFMSVFQRNFLTIATASDAEKDIVLKEGNNLWFQLIAIRPPMQASFAPEAGQLAIASKMKYYISYVNERKKDTVFHSQESYSVQDVSIEFNSGYIENIAATVLIQGKPRTYINIYGIGFSSIGNQNKLNSIRLYEKGARSFPNKTPMNAATAARSEDNYTYIILGELLQYKNKLEVDRRDYSPRDTAITVFGGQNVTLYKEETNKLFEARIFSDFIGLQEDKPNGLIQTEVEKRININTIQWQVTRALFPIFKSYGIFQYILPNITLSKLEQHNRHYVLGDLDSIRYNPGTNDTSKLQRHSHRYATPLDLYQHQSFSVGCDLNVLFLANHNLKFNMYFNIGGRLGITPVVDSLTDVTPTSITKTGITREYSINTLQIVPQVKLVFLPEERFNFSMSYQAMYIKPFASGVELLGFTKEDPSKFQLQRNKWLNTMEMLLSFNVNKSGEGKVFARARFISEIANYKSNFAQIQIGYSTYIFGKAK